MAWQSKSKTSPFGRSDIHVLAVNNSAKAGGQRKMVNSIFSSKDYRVWLSEIKSRIAASRIHAARSLNKELIKLYWDIGKSIVESQSKHKWGQSIVEQLSRDLVGEYENFRGFSPDNLWRMRMFYLAYKDQPKLAQLVPEIPWENEGQQRPIKCLLLCVIPAKAGEVPFRVNPGNKSQR